MKPAQFLYRDPMTIEEALDLLAEYGEDARLLAGGQSLVPLLNFRLVQPAVIIDLNGIDELGNIQVADDSFRIGSMARQAAVENHRDIIRGWPLLIDALRHVAHPPIRNRGTIGGSLAHNDPAAELPAVMVVLGARMILQSATAQRTVPAESFFVSPLETLLAPNELLIAIEAPVPNSSAGWGFAEISRRHGDFALAAAAVQQIPGDAARTPGARIVVTGVAERPLRVTEAENKVGPQLDQFWDYLTNPQADMMRIELEILGDPGFLSQDMYTTLGPENETNSARGDGKTDYNDIYNCYNVDSVLPIIGVNYRMPGDIDVQSGLMFNSGELESNIFFNGVYQVNKVESRINNGQFTQMLYCTRLNNQFGTGMPGGAKKHYIDPHADYEKYNTPDKKTNVIDDSLGIEGDVDLGVVN